jgi:cation diffusion facilitator family transporter
MQHHRYDTAKRITLIGALVNAVLGLIKLIGGLVFHSHALAADGLHSFADLLTDGMVLFASKYSHQGADDRHPYGHQRIETAATFLLSLLMILTGLGICWDTYLTLFTSHPEPDVLALPIAILAVLANEGLFYATRVIGERINSPLIIANAWHHRSDSASSIVVVVGLLASLAGFAYWDAIAGLIVGLIIIHMGITYAWNSIKELVDTAIAPDELAKIKELIQQIDGVIKIHQLRSRMMGPDIFIDVHIQVSPFISVSEGHYIAQHVHYLLMQHNADIKDVTVHVDPEDDEISPPSLNLPNRLTIEQNLINPWREQFPTLHHYTIHYAAGSVVLDLFASKWTKTCQKQLEQACLQLNYPIQLRFFRTPDAN